MPEYFLIKRSVKKTLPKRKSLPLRERSSFSGIFPHHAYATQLFLRVAKNLASQVFLTPSYARVRLSASICVIVLVWVLLSHCIAYALEVSTSLNHRCGAMKLLQSLSRRSIIQNLKFFCSSFANLFSTAFTV